MRPAPTWRAVVEADRLDRSYARRVDEHLRSASGGSYLGTGPLLLLKWGLPAIPLVVRLLGGDVSSRWWPISVGLVVLLATVASEDSAARRTPFEALRFPDTGALLVARYVRRLPWLTWAGACLGALRAIQMTEAGVAGRLACVLAATLLAVAPAQVLASRVVFVAAESIHPRPTWGWRRAIRFILLGAFFGAMGFGALHSVFDDGFGVAIFAFSRGPGVVSFTVRPRRLLAALSDIGWLAATGGVAIGAFRHGKPEHEWIVVATLAVLVLQALVAAPLFVRWAACQRPVFGKEEEKAAATKAASTVGSPSTSVERSLVRRAPGVGLWRAAWRRRTLWFQRTMPVTAPWWGQTIWLVIMSPLWAAWLGRSVLGAMAVILWADSPGFPWIVGALAVALFAPTIVAEGLEERLFLLGVDARELVAHDLRAFVLVGAVPTLVAGSIAACARGFDPVSIGALTTIAALLLLRAGWDGIWPVHTSCATAGVLLIGVPLAVVFGPSPANAIPWAIATGLVGIVGTWKRVAGRTEEDLREAMRE